MLSDADEFGIFPSASLDENPDGGGPSAELDAARMRLRRDCRETEGETFLGGVMIQVNTTNFVLAGGSEPGLLLSGAGDRRRAACHRAARPISVCRLRCGGRMPADLPCRLRVCGLWHSAGQSSVAGLALPWTGWGEERRLLKRIRPAAVISLGGAIGESVGHAAAGLGLPLAVLEQHVTASRATRRLATKAAVVCLGFEETRHRLAANCPVRVTGIPIGPARACLRRTRQRRPTPRRTATPSPRNRGGWSSWATAGRVAR